MTALKDMFKSEELMFMFTEDRVMYNLRDEFSNRIAKLEKRIEELEKKECPKEEATNSH